FRPDYFSAARDTQTISLSLRAYTDLWAKAGYDQTTLRPAISLVGSSRLTRPSSSYPFGDSLARIRSPFSLNRKKRSPCCVRKALAQRRSVLSSPVVGLRVIHSRSPVSALRQRTS